MVQEIDIKNLQGPWNWRGGRIQKKLYHLPHRPRPFLGKDTQICHQKIVKQADQEKEFQICQDPIKEIDLVQERDIQISHQKLMKDTLNIMINY